MKKSCTAFFSGLLAALVLATGPARALEMRTWTSVDGKTMEAELVGVNGGEVTVKDNTGRQITFKTNRLSHVDLLYLKAHPGAEQGGVKAGEDGKGRQATISPAKNARVDRKTFKKSGQFQAGQVVLEVLETPHFKVMYSKDARPEDLAELAERLWIDAAFYYPDFPQKFTGNRFAIFLLDSEESVNGVGQWYTDMLARAGAKREAALLRAAWGRIGTTALYFPPAIADANSIFPRARVFIAFLPSEGPDGRFRPAQDRGVWDPMRVNAVAGDLLNIASRALRSSDVPGSCALVVGYANYKEVLFAGGEGGLIPGVLTPDNAWLAAAFAGSTPRDWPDQMRKLIRKGEFKPNLDMLFQMRDDNAGAETRVLAYSFAHFLHSSPERVAGWCALVKKAGEADDIPEREEMARLLGFASSEALEKQWLEYIASSRFK